MDLDEEPPMLRNVRERIEETEPWTLEDFWADLDDATQGSRAPQPLRLGNAVQNYYFLVTRVPNSVHSYMIQRYIPALGDEAEIGELKHTYEHLTHFNIWLDRLNAEGYDYELL